MKKIDAQVDELRMEVARLTRELARLTVRQAEPFVIRQGRWLCVLNGALAQGGTATAEIIRWSATDSEWQRSGKTITVHEAYMNTGDTAIPTGTILEAILQDGIWRAGLVGCAANNWLGA